MDAERAPGPTFALEDTGFLDFESRSRCPITAGTYRYTTEADAIILAYAIGGAKATTVVALDYTEPLTWKRVPYQFQVHHERVLEGKAVWAAWNASFTLIASSRGLLVAHATPPASTISRFATPQRAASVAAIFSLSSLAASRQALPTMNVSRLE